MESGSGLPHLASTTGAQAQIRAGADRRGVSRGVRARALQVALVLLVEAAVVFGAAGRLDWIWAWIFLAIYVASIALNAAFLRRNPEIVAERGRPPEVKRWDKVVSGLWGLVQYLLLPLIAGLDERFAWTGSLDVGWHLAGAALFALGLGLFGWAMITNAYFSTAARVQSDRGQTVCRSGPYRFVRHPGYSGTVLQSLGAALLLGSAWALVPGLAAACLMVARTALEDRMLQSGLAGYAAYVRDVRFRLVPGIW